jgi:hypothetical protein
MDLLNDSFQNLTQELEEVPPTNIWNYDEANLTGYIPVLNEFWLNVDQSIPNELSIPLKLQRQ